MKNIKLWIGLCVVIFAFGIAGIFIVMRKPQSTLIEIVQGGNMLYRLDLEHTEDQIINIEYEGKRNVIEIKNHQIHILEAECPDQTCVRMGYLKSGNLPIVCLPNRLAIQFGQDDGDTDAIAR